MVFGVASAAQFAVRADEPSDKPTEPAVVSDMDAALERMRKQQRRKGGGGGATIIVDRGQGGFAPGMLRKGEADEAVEGLDDV